MSHRTVKCQEEVRAPHSVQGLCEGGLRLLEDSVSLLQGPSVSLERGCAHYGRGFFLPFLEAPCFSLQGECQALGCGN